MLVKTGSNREDSHSMLVGMQNGTATLENSLAGHFYKIHIFFSYDLIAILGIYCSNVLKTCVHTKTCTCMFMATLFIIAKTWKYPRCSSVGE